MFSPNANRMIAGIVPLSLVDVPNNPAITVFTRGCNLRCPYCHNPELVRRSMTAPSWDRDRFDDFLRKRRAVIQYIAVTGGEPTLHPGLPAFLDHVRSLGFRVKLDTNGSRPAVVQHLLEAGFINYIAMDVKTWWDHYDRVGAPEGVPFRETAKIIQTLAPDYEFRTTVAPGIVGWEDLRALAQDLMGSRRYVLQQFVSHNALLDSAWAAVPPYPDAIVRAWAHDLEPYYDTVFVRNLGLS